MLFSRLITLDVGASHIAGGVFEGGANRPLRLLRLASIPFDSAPSAIECTSEHLKIFLREFAIGESRGAAAALCVPGHHVLLKTGQAPMLEGAEQPDAVQFAASQLIPCSLAEVVWGHQLLTTVGAEADLLVAAARLATVQGLCDATQAAGVDLKRIEAGALALRAGFRFNHPDANVGVIVADVGARSTSLLFLDGERFTARTFALGGNRVTEALATKLKIEFGAAEILKREIFSRPAPRESTTPEAVAILAAKADFVRRLQLEILRSSLSHRRRTGAPPPTQLYLAGGAAEIPDLPGLLSEEMKLGVERYDPLANVKVTEEAAGAAESLRASLASSVGLAVPLVTGESCKINLRPFGPRTGPKRWQREYLLAAGTLVLMALLLPFAGYFHLRSHRLRGEVRLVERQTAPLRAMQKRNTAQLSQLDELRGKIAAAECMLALKTSWAGFLGDLQARLGEVGDVWLDRLAVLPPSVGQNRISPETPGAKTPGPFPLRMSISGRLLDVSQPLVKVSAEATARVNQLIAGVAGSPWIGAVEQERFESTQAGLLQFELTLVMNASRPL